MGAKETNIPDPDGAKDGLVKMGASARALVDQLKPIISDIRQMGAQEPWGHSDTVGRFTKIYGHDDQHGAGGVLKNVDQVSSYADNMAKTGYVALSASIDQDDEEGKSHGKTV